MLGQVRAAILFLLHGTREGRSVVPAAPRLPLGEIIRRFWPYARPYRGWLILTALLVLLGSAVEAASLWMYKLLVDEVLVPQDFGAFPRLALIYVGLIALVGLTSFLDEYLSAWIGGRFLLTLRADFFRHLHALSLDFFDRRQLGDIIARISDDLSSIEYLLLSGVVNGVYHAARVLFFVGALFYLNWQLALVALLVAPLFWLLTRHSATLLKSASREQRRRSGSLSAVAEESLANAALVQAYNRQDDELRRFQRENVGRFEAHLSAARLKALFPPLVDIIELLGMLAVVGVGAWQVSQNMLTLGGLMAFVAYLKTLYSPIRGLSRLLGSFYSASAGAERVIEFLDQQPAVRERPGALRLGRVAGHVVLDRVAFRYPETEREALHDVSFEVEPGRTLAVVGPSGAGKTTLLKLLLRFADPAAGAVRVDGHDLRDVDLHSLRECMAVVLQEALIFDATVRDNIAYGRPSASDYQIVQAAIAADAHDFIAKLPGGYDTVVGQKGRRLSGGQRQRIAIARAMIRSAPILILDEPTTGLDASSQSRLLGPLRRLIEGRTTIIISHNLMNMRAADSIIVLDQGRIVERGTHQELLAIGGAYARLYRLHHGDEPPDARGPVGARRLRAGSLREILATFEQSGLPVACSALPRERDRADRPIAERVES